MKLKRALLPAALVAALLTTTACSAGGGPTQDSGGNDCLAAGDASKSVKVSGDFGKQPELTSKTPVRAEESERSVVTEGKGDVVADGDVLTFNVTMINGATGEVLELPDATGETVTAFNEDIEIPFQLSAMGNDPLLGDLLRCATEGQRAVSVVPLEQLLGGADPAENGIPDMKAEDSIVVVSDTTKIVRGEGAAEEEAAATACDAFEKRDEKYPEVDLGDGSAEPEITIPECMEPPTEIEIDVLEEGDGEVVKADEKIMTNYVGVDWNGAERFDGNWTAEGIEFSTAEGALIPGFTQAMVGQKIGSTVLVTMPPELGYDDGMTRTFVLQLVSKVS